MHQPAGLKIIERFQLTLKTQSQSQSQAADHGAVRYEVASFLPPSSSHVLPSLPVITWWRSIPVNADGGEIDNDGSDEECYGGGYESQSQQYIVPLPPPSQLASQSTVAPITKIDWKEEREPHVLLCLSAEEFVTKLLPPSGGSSSSTTTIDRLLLELQTQIPSGQYHILVIQLDHYLNTRQRKEFKQGFKNGTLGGGFSRAPIDAALLQLAMTKNITFRDLRDELEAADYVYRLTTAIARKKSAKSEVSKWMAARGGRDTQAMNTLLASHPLEDPAEVVLTKALYTLPSVPPGVAHAVATEYKSLARLASEINGATSTCTVIQQQQQVMVRLTNMRRVGTRNVTRVGPKAANQILDVLSTKDPDKRITNLGGGE
jgi:hypothetical protein